MLDRIRDFIFEDAAIPLRSGEATGPGGGPVTKVRTFARHSRKEAGRFTKFLVVGAIGFVVDFGVFNLLHQLLGVTEVVAQALSFSTAVASNFAWNYFWIYPEARSKPVLGKIGQFVVVSLIGLLIRTPIFAFTLPLARQAVVALGLPHGLPIDLGNNLALVCAVSVVLLWNFFVNRYWTYKDVP